MSKFWSRVLITLVGICSGLSFIYPTLINLVAGFTGVATLLSVFLVCGIPLCKWAYKHGTEVGEDVSSITGLFDKVKDLHTNKVSLWYSHIVTAFSLVVLMYHGWVFLPSMYIVLWMIKHIQVKDIVENY